MLKMKIINKCVNKLNDKRVKLEFFVGMNVQVEGYKVNFPHCFLVAQVHCHNFQTNKTDYIFFYKKWGLFFCLAKSDQKLADTIEYLYNKFMVETLTFS